MTTTHADPAALLALAAPAWAAWVETATRQDLLAAAASMDDDAAYTRAAAVGYRARGQGADAWVAGRVDAAAAHSERLAALCRSLAVVRP